MVSLTRNVSHSFFLSVAQERGTMSPRQTRSAKMREVFRTLDFSPSSNQDQVNETDTQGEISSTAAACAAKKDAGDALLESTLQDMEDEVANYESSKSPISSFATLEDRQNSDNITDVLKSLTETVHQLIEQKKQSDRDKEHNQKLQPVVPGARQSLAQIDCELEERNQLLERQMEEIESKNVSERERMITHNTRLEAELAITNREADARIQGLEEARQRLEMRLTSLNDEKSALSNKVSTLETEISDAQEALRDSKVVLEDLKRDHKAKHAAMERNERPLTEGNSTLSYEFERTKLQNESLNATIKSWDHNISDLEFELLPESQEQLQEARKKMDRLEKAEIESKAKISYYQQEIEKLNGIIKKIGEQKEEECHNFRTLNESSSHTYEKTMKGFSEKDAIIGDLKEKLALAEDNLSAESHKVEHLRGNKERLNSEMDERLKDLQTSLDESLQALKASSTNTKELDKKLQQAYDQIGKDKNLTEEVIVASKEKSAALEETDKVAMAITRRIKELEHQVKKTIEGRDYARERMTTFNDREGKPRFYSSKTSIIEVGSSIANSLCRFHPVASLFQRLRCSDRVRRDLHNRAMQLSGNIRVYVRIRPVLASDLEASEKSVKPPAMAGQKRKLDYDEEENSLFSFPGELAGLERRVAKTSNETGTDDPTKNILELREPYKDRGGLSERKKKWIFCFDRIFDPSHGQEDIWEATEPLVQSTIDGFNVTVLAYGQTGSGKTHTMLGEEGNKGIVARAVSKLFDAKSDIEDLSRGEKTVEVALELLEIYNEQVRDLLVPNSGADGLELSLKVNANEAVGSLVLPVGTKEEVHEILHKAQQRRCVKATSSNPISSRSHMIFTIHFKVISKSGATRIGKLHVCDLAGSERLGKSNVFESSLLRETKHINTSLSVLSNVIEKLQAGDTNVPYRESNLTYLLQNSLGGNSKTLAVVCCNPLQRHFHEALCSLRFAAKVNKVDLKAVANFSC